ncbi:winged helix-turn-helix transcriptional regulator [Streptosporangiaceae bacterium NEAU-GS5]|nr:winged helix-turn-helix transcriptional regulator [Streptosporangiaceae bacterium NEAU-GS5]
MPRKGTYVLASQLTTPTNSDEGHAGARPAYAYHHIADDIAAQIKQGQLAVQSALPSDRRLAGHYGVNRLTVRAALARLRTWGLVETRPGKGSFVVHPQPPPSTKEESSP